MRPLGRGQKNKEFKTQKGRMNVKTGRQVQEGRQGRVNSDKTGGSGQKKTEEETGGILSLAGKRRA